MAEASPFLMRLSQGHLNTWERCPRKFQQIYLDQLGSAPTPEQQQRSDWGNRFHLLMQQRELGLPIEPFLSTDSELNNCISALIQAAPEIFAWEQRDETVFRQSEYRLTLKVQDYLLTAIYDLVILDGQRGQILDWKTYPRPPKGEQLAQDWQTRLYLFLLCETTGYAPENISMTYWFVRSRQPNPHHSPQKLTFSYSQVQHEQTLRDLNRHLDKITLGLAQYKQGESFAHRVATEPNPEGQDKGIVQCPVCDLEIAADHPPVLEKLPDFSEIPEVTL